MSATMQFIHIGIYQFYYKDMGGMKYGKTKKTDVHNGNVFKENEEW